MKSTFKQTKFDIGEIVTNDTTYPISNTIQKKLLHNDIVLYQEICHETNIIVEHHSNDFIFGVLYLNTNTISGIFNKKPMKKFVPFNKLYPEFLIPINKNLIKETKNKYCLIKIKEWINTKYPIGSMKSTMGDVGNYDADCNYIKYLHNIKLNNIADIVLNTDISPNRIDLTHLITFSIDPDNCKDIDDAISLEINDNVYKLYIHIADVSSFFESDTEFDEKILNRTETLYLHKNQINMLPNNMATNH